MTKLLRFFTVILTATILFSCATTPVQEIPTKATIAVKPGEHPRPMQFRRVVVKLRRGQVIGQVGQGWLCIRNSDLTWRGGRLTWSTDELDDVFREELEKNNYEVVGDPDALFEDPTEWKAELLVAGLVTDMRANVCYPNSGFGNFRDAKGDAYMKVEWQVYSRLDRQVVYKTITEGNAKVTSASSTGALDIFYNAFAEATNNLLADQKFYQLVTSTYHDVKQASAGAEYKTLSLAIPSKVGGDVTKRMLVARSAVVTIYAGDGHGSGFIVSPSGYVLTNAHVVGGAKFVKVKLPTGREILGEVIRKQKRRDVALIKVEEAGLPALPIRDDELEIGSEVYAIGSPLDDELSTTVSRGIISAYRNLDGLPYIQSDVNVQPGSSGGPLIDGSGNVIGVASMVRRGVVGEIAGLNFFIPAHDALRWINVSRSGR